MKLLDKSELNAYLGKEGSWSQKRLVGKLDHVSGIEAFERVPKREAYSNLTGLVHMMVRPAGLELQLMLGFKSYRVGLRREDVKAMTLEDKERITEMKDKSVVGRALIGGLLLGPVGAIVGGMTGIGSNEVNTSAPDILVSIEHEVDGKDGIILLSANHKDRNEIVRFMTAYLPNFHVSVPSSMSSPAPNASGGMSKVEQLERLANLKERGMISEEEFASMKVNVLRGT